MSAAEMREALKPCPFCGGADIRRDDHGLPVSFACEDCGARGGASEEDVSEAADFWNRRAPLPEEEGMVERVARALLVSEREAYANSPELLDEHFEWWRAGKDNPDSCVHYSSIGIAVRQARAAIRAINRGKP